MFTVPFAHRKEKTVAVLDIGSGSVGYCLVQIGRHNAPPKILASERLVLPFETRTAEQTQSAVLALLSAACEKAVSIYSQTLSQKGAPPISASYAILRAPWVRSEFASAQIEFETDQRITEEVLGKLEKQVLASESPPTPVVALQTSKVNKQNLFEAGVVSVNLNGYATRKSLGKFAHSVSVTALLSECESGFYTKINDTLHSFFSFSKPNLRSTTRALLSLLQDSDFRSRDRMIIDVENEATNFVVMRKGIVAENFLVPEGTKSILARISSGPGEETLSLMRMMSRGTCSTSACEKMNSSLARIEPELVKTFGDALGRLVSTRRLPNELLLIAEPELSQWLSVFFSRIDFCQFTLTTKPFTPTILNSETPGAIDAGLGVAVSFVNREAQSTD